MSEEGGDGLEVISSFFSEEGCCVAEGVDGDVGGIDVSNPLKGMLHRKAFRGETLRGRHGVGIYSGACKPFGRRVGSEMRSHS